MRVESDFRAVAERVARRCAAALIAANVAGALVVFVLGVWVIPAPHVHDTHQLRLLNLAVLGVVLVAGFPLASIWAKRAWLAASVWIREDRAPTPAERDTSINFCFTLVRNEAVMWVLAAVPFVVLNAFWSAGVALETGVEILLGGLTTCALAYLLDERLSRPLVAEALRRTPVERSEPGCFGVRAHLTLAWIAGAVVPLAALGLLGAMVLSGVDVSPERIAMAVVVLGAVGIVAGYFVNATMAGTLSESLMALRTAVADVEDGKLDTRVTVDDASEVGMLQSGFNSMVEGLRERDRLRDLFGRQVGQDVAREA